MGVLIRPCSKVIIKFLQVMMKNGYIGEFEVVDDHRAGKVVVNLNGRVNKCGVLSPRFDMQFKDNEKWVTNLLPSRQFGHIVLTTSQGIMGKRTHMHIHPRPSSGIMTVLGSRCMSIALATL